MPELSPHLFHNIKAKMFFLDLQNTDLHKQDDTRLAFDLIKDAKLESATKMSPIYTFYLRSEVRKSHNNDRVNILCTV